MSDARLSLDDTDRHSLVWRKLEAYINERIDELRMMNDNDKDAIETARLRGRIAELKILLTQATPAPAFVVNDG